MYNTTSARATITANDKGIHIWISIGTCDNRVIVKSSIESFLDKFPLNTIHYIAWIESVN